MGVLHWVINMGKTEFFTAAPRCAPYTCARRNAYETSNALGAVHQNANVFYPRW